MAELDPENTLVLETTKGKATSRSAPTSRPTTWRGSRSWRARASTTGRRSTASSTASWRRAATRQAPGPAARARSSRPNSAPRSISAASARWRARRAPNSADSQFFICLADSPWLDKQYTVWGRVVDGMDMVDKIKQGEPVKDPDKIVSMKVLADAA